MARELDAILKELDAGYDPERQRINAQLTALPAEADAQISGLNAQKDQAFNDILGGARDRGLGFSGIPLQEQAKYSATNFLPAVANVRSTQNQRAGSLSDALNNVNLDQRKYAQSIRDSELSRDEQQRQFNAQLAAQDRAAKAAAAAAGGFGISAGGGGAAAQAAAKAPSIQDQAYLNVQGFLKQGRAAAESDYQATLNSANRGNALDKLKVQLYNQAGIGRSPLNIAGTSAQNFNGLSGNILSGLRI